MDDKTKLTKEGFEKLKLELNRRISIERKNIADDIEKARQQGDLSENASYKAALENKEFNEMKIKELDNLLAHTEIITKNKNTIIVQLGSRVKVSEEGKENIRIFDIVGDNEANPAENKISFKSPLAVALIGKRVGSIVKFKTQMSEIKYKILGIE